MRIGVFGGEFSPPHKGYVETVKAFLTQMRLDLVYIAVLDGDVPAAHRVRMCELAFEGVDGIVVIDLSRKKDMAFPKDLLSELARPDARLFWLCGSETLLGKTGKFDEKTVFGLAYPVYFRQDEDPGKDKEIVARIAAIKDLYGRQTVRLVTDPVLIREGEIRKMLKSGIDTQGSLPDAVKRYIQENELYKEEKT